ncbi:uncharacterized protein [Halyomorpha halys]
MCEEIEISLEKVFKKEQEFFESLVNNSKSTDNSLEDKIKYEKDNLVRKREKKNLLLAKVIAAKQSLDELLLKKRTLEGENNDVVSRDELSEMLQKVVKLEKEQQLRQDDMKMNYKVFVGQMSFYKEYLDIYIDIPNNNDFILYFRKCRAEDNNKPQEWLRIKTDDFRKFLVVDISSRGQMNYELLEKIKSTDKHLRELVIDARELCLNVL